jgi:hypothetical protein
MSIRFPALRWTTLLLLASIALTTIGVVEAGRAVRSQRAVAEHALRDYAGFAAWSYQQHLREGLGSATEELLGAFNHGHDVHRGPNTPPATDVAHYIYFDRACNCHVPQRGPIPPRSSPSAGHRYARRRAQLAHGSGKGWEVDRAPSPAMAEWGAQRYDAATRAGSTTPSRGRCAPRRRRTISR